MYDNYIASKYPSTLMAINNRCGIYNSNDIFCEGANYIENCIKGTLKAFKDDIILFLFNIKNTEILNNNQKNSIEFIVQDINTYFFRYVELINNYFSDKLKDKIYSEKDEVFWSKVVRRWGKGSGYRLDIMNYYKENIVLKKFMVFVNLESFDIQSRSIMKFIIYMERYQIQTVLSRNMS